MNQPLATALLLTMLVTGTCSRAALPAQDPLRILEAYNGTWKVSIRTLDAAGNDHGTETTELNNSCHQFRKSYACEQVVDGDPKALVVFTYDPDTQKYRSFPIAVNAKQAGSGTLEIHGATWTYPWVVEEEGISVSYRVVNVFDSPTHITYQKQKSIDGTTWTLLEAGQEDRIRD